MKTTTTLVIKVVTTYIFTNITSKFLFNLNFLLIFKQKKALAQLKYA